RNSKPRRRNMSIRASRRSSSVSPLPAGKGLRFEAIQLFAVELEPVLGGFVIGAEILDEFPEAFAVVHVAQVCDFVNDDIFHDLERGEHQAPGEGEVAVARTGAPAAARIAHGDTVDAAADLAGLLGGDFLDGGQSDLAQRFGDALGELVACAAYVECFV